MTATATSTPSKMTTGLSTLQPPEAIEAIEGEGPTALPPPPKASNANPLRSAKWPKQPGNSSVSRLCRQVGTRWAPLRLSHCSLSLVARYAHLQRSVLLHGRKGGNNVFFSIPLSPLTAMGRPGSSGTSANAILGMSRISSCSSNNTPSPCSTSNRLLPLLCRIQTR